MKPNVKLVGYASGIAANNKDCALGPWYVYYHPEFFYSFTEKPSWQAMIHDKAVEDGQSVLPLVINNIQQLSNAILPLSQASSPFCVLGGDHSCAIGTWSAVAHVNRSKGDIGLIWIDAHMDSHTFETSLSQNIHGMPVAHLLGFGDEHLSKIFDEQPKIKPENLCIIGIRSYEPAEAALLNRLGVKLFFMDDIQKRGIYAVLQDAYQHISQTTCGFGISIDLDSIDPLDAPGVGCPEPNGINGHELITALQSMKYTHPLLGLEIAEYNPLRDQQEKTANLLVKLIKAIYHD